MALEPTTDTQAETWQRFPICRIEDLRNAVLGADLEAMQMAGSPVCGSLAFCARRGIVFSTGVIDGKVALRGTLANDAVTLVLFPTLGSGSRLRLENARAGDAVVLMPGDELDAICATPSVFFAATLTLHRFREELVQYDESVFQGMCAETGIFRAAVPFRDLVEIRRLVALVHSSACNAVRPGSMILRRLIWHLTHAPFKRDLARRGRRARLVYRARNYIHEHIDAPIRMPDLALATNASVRTLHRAFNEILEQTPQTYVRRVRLHGVRHELLFRHGMVRKIGDAAARWGAAGDPGRLAASYRALFGEKPSKTLAVARERARQPEWM